MGANTLGIDASESNIRIASVHALADPQLRPSSGKVHLRYLNTPAEALLSQPKRYDIVCSMEVLEHVDNPAAFLSTCAELLKVELQSLFSASLHHLIECPTFSPVATCFSQQFRVLQLRMLSPSF